MLKWSGSFSLLLPPLRYLWGGDRKIGVCQVFQPENMRTPNTCWKALGNKEFIPVIATLPAGWKTCRSCLWVLNLMDLSGISWRKGIRTVALWRRGYSNRITLLQRYQLVILIILWEENRRNTPPKKTRGQKGGSYIPELLTAPGSGHSAGCTCHPDSWWSTPWYPRHK